MEKLIEEMMQTFKDLWAIVQNFSFKSFFTETLPNGLGNTLTLGIIILVVFGIAECLFGWQLLRIELTLMAFAGVAFLSGMITSAGYFDPYLTETWMLQLALITCGLIAGIFTWYHPNLAFFLGMMGISGFLIFTFLTKMMGDSQLIPAIIATALSVPIAFLLKQLLMPLIVAASSAGGALIIALSISGFLRAFLPSAGLMLMTDLTVTGLIFQVRRLLKNKVNSFMQSTLRSTNSFLSRYEGDVTSISRNFFSRIGF